MLEIKQLNSNLLLNYLKILENGIFHRKITIFVPEI